MNLHLKQTALPYDAAVLCRVKKRKKKNKKNIHCSRSVHIKFIHTRFFYDWGVSHYICFLRPCSVCLPVLLLIWRSFLLVCKSLNSSVPEDVWCAFKIQYVSPRSFRPSVCLLAVPRAKSLIHSNVASSHYGHRPLKQPFSGPEGARVCNFQFF